MRSRMKLYIELAHLSASDPIRLSLRMAGALDSGLSTHAAPTEQSHMLPNLTYYMRLCAIVERY